MKKKFKDVFIIIKKNPKDFIIILLLSINLLLSSVFIFKLSDLQKDIEFLEDNIGYPKKRRYYLRLDPTLKGNIEGLKEDIEGLKEDIEDIKGNLIGHMENLRIMLTH